MSEKMSFGRESKTGSSALFRGVTVRRFLSSTVIGVGGAFVVCCVLPLAGAGGLSLLTSTTPPWLWLLSAVALGLGGWRVIHAAGCGIEAEPEAPPPGLTSKARRMRNLGALGFLGLSTILGVVAIKWVPLLWPITVVAGWFSISFLVAGATGYVGCPEIGAIPSWVLGRTIATSCPPLETSEDASPSGP